MSSNLSYPVNPTPQAPRPEPNEPQSAEPRAKNVKGGCAGCLFIILGLLLLVYILAFQTSIPLKMIAGSIEKNNVIDGRRMEINGVGGSLSRGVKIKELIIPGKHGDTTITGLKFRYKKPLRIFTRGQVTLTEVSTSSAEFIVSNDFFESDEPDEGMEDEWESEFSESEQSSSNSEGFFDLHLLNFKNTRIRTIDGSVDIDIPLIRMKGLHIDHNDFKIEEFKIESDVLSASLNQGSRVEIEGDMVTFDQRIDIIIKPEIHASVIKDIPISFEFRKQEGLTISRITAFNGSMEQVGFGDKRSQVRFESLSPLDYLTFEGHVIPNELTLSALEKGNLIKMDAGSFVIGQTTFKYDGRVVQADEEETIFGKASAGPYEVSANIRPNKSDKGWPPIYVELSSEPEAPKHEILAQLYHGKDYSSLSPEEKTAIDELK